MSKLETATLLKNAGASKDLHSISGKELLKLQRVLMEMTEDVNKVCREEGINYALGGGSCLGAVRHGGFIPWDDDIDINIMRRDVNKFCKAIKKKYSDKYWLHEPETAQNTGVAFIRIRKKGTTLRSREDFHNGNKEDGICLDFFIVENTYNNVILRKLHEFLSLATGFLYSCRNFYELKDLYREVSDGNKELRKASEKKIFIGRLLSFMKRDTYIHLWNNVNKMCHNDKTKYVTIPTGRKHFSGEMLSRDLVENTEDCKFDKYSFRIYKNYDTYLTNLYGDYMKIPKDHEVHMCMELDFGDRDRSK